MVHSLVFKLSLRLTPFLSVGEFEVSKSGWRDSLMEVILSFNAWLSLCSSTEAKDFAIEGMRRDRWLKDYIQKGVLALLDAPGGHCGSKRTSSPRCSRF